MENAEALNVKKSMTYTKKPEPELKKSKTEKEYLEDGVEYNRNLENIDFDELWKDMKKDYGPINHIRKNV